MKLTPAMRKRLRAAKTEAESIYGLGGLLKRKGAPQPVTLPALKRIQEREGKR